MARDKLRLNVAAVQIPIGLEEHHAVRSFIRGRQVIVFHLRLCTVLCTVFCGRYGLLDLFHTGRNVKRPL
jgi:hypothetical protein